MNARLAQSPFARFLSAPAHGRRSLVLNPSGKAYEAFGVGLGQYLVKHGYRERFKVMIEHLQKVLEITRKYQLSPIMWSDMIFHFLSDDTRGFHYNLNADFSPEKIADLPKDVQFVYWDYGQRDQAAYELCIEKHRELGSTPLFAGGIHTWGSLSPNYGKIG
jgi:hexosaminidase